jgi:flagellar biogenesis protein FliO
VAAATTTKAETTEEKKARTSPLPSQPTSGQLFVLSLLLLGAVFTGVFLRRRAVVEHSHLDVVATRTLGRGKQLVVVDAGDARLLLGVTEQGITLLSSMPSSSSEASPASSSRPKLSLLTEEEEAATSSPAAGLFKGFGKGLGAKVGGLWGRPPAGPPADWDSFDRILASSVPDSSAHEPAPSNSRRSSERASSTTGSADIAELARELQKHGVRRSA